MATRVSYVEFSGTQYGTIPAGALGNAQVFTIEAVISTTSTNSRNLYYQWGTIVGVEIANTWKDDFSFCVNGGQLCFWAQSKRNTSPKNYKVDSSVRINDGKKHKVAMVSNVDGSIDLYCDGVKVAHTESVEATIASTTLYIAYNNGNRYAYLPMRLYELRLWNVARSQSQIFADLNGNESGLRAWYVAENTSYMKDLTGRSGNATLYGSPTVFSSNYGLKFDTRIDIQNLEKGWLIGTLGKAEEIVKRIEPNKSTGITHTVPEDNDRIRRRFNYVGLPETKSRTGYAFDHFEETNYIYDQYFILNIPATKDFWIKFDVYFQGEGDVTVGDSRNGVRAGDGTGTANSLVGDNAGIRFHTVNTYNPAEAIFYLVDSGEVYDSGTVSLHNISTYVTFPDIKKNQLSTVLVHFRSGRTDGIIEAWWNGVKVQGGNSSNDTSIAYWFKGNVNRGENFTDLYLHPSGLVSNVLVSNMRIGFDATTTEVILSLDISVEIEPSTAELQLDVKIKIAQHFLIPLDVKRSIIALYVDVIRNILAEIIFSPLETDEIFQRGITHLKALKSGTALRDTGTITATSFDSNEIESNVTSLRNTIGLQSLEVHIAEQQLTDQVTFAATLNFEIMQYFDGQYFDYYYRLRIESRQQQGLIFTYNCCSNIDELLYTQIAYKVTTTETVHDDTQEQASEESEEEKTIEEEEQELLATGEYHTLFDNAVAVANYFGLSPIVQLGDYAGFYSSYKEQDLWGRTYADAIREVFGWSSRIPHKMINVYIRGDKMFFIRRGCEANVIDISKTQHTMPIINREIVRTFWGTTQWSQTEIKEKFLGTRGLGGDSGDNDNFPADYINNSDDDDKENVWSAVGSVITTSSAGTSVTQYDYTSNGVLRGTTTTFTSNSDESQNSRTVVRNAYNDDGLLEAVQTEVTHPNAPENDTKTLVKYGYMTIGGGQTFLASEITAEYEKNADGDYELVDTKATAKSPTGRGQGTSYDSKGKGTASGNVGDDRVTPYQLRTAFNTTEALSVQILKKTTTTKINGFTDIDPSFPLLLLADRATVTNEIVWLNRKIKESVSVSVYDFGHIIDFNDRIILDGKEYFVANNTVRTAPRLYNEQNLSLVRWFQ